MKKSPPSPPFAPFRSSSSSPSNYAPFSSPNMIPVNKSNKSKPKHKKAKNSAHVESSRRRSSTYRGVTRHRGTGRYEAHLWDKTWQNPVRKRRGRQVYLGAYDDEVDAARAHDVAALKLWGPQTVLNFPVEMYKEKYKEMQTMSKEEVLASLRRKSDGFARGYSKYRGVARHHRDGRWEARLGQALGCKYIYLGTYETEEAAAQAYDLAVLKHKGPNIVTNFASSVYKHRQWPFMQLPGNPGVFHKGPNMVTNFASSVYKHRQWQLPGNPRVEPVQEHARVVQMEATGSVDQTVPNDDMLEFSSTNFASSDCKHHLWQFMQLPGNPGVEPAQEHPKIAQMETTESTDQTVPTDDMLGILRTLDMDHDFSAYTLPNVTIDDDLHGILNNHNFEENIEQLFEAFETLGDNKSGSSRDGFGASEGA